MHVKWARGSRPRHNMTSVFVSIFSKVEILLHIGHITDSPVIWPMWNRVENGPSWYLSQIILCHFLGRSNITNHLSLEHVKLINLYLDLMYFYLDFIFKIRRLVYTPTPFLLGGGVSILQNFQKGSQNYFFVITKNLNW